jgi:hypothetical protein
LSPPNCVNDPVADCGAVSSLLTRAATVMRSRWETAAGLSAAGGETRNRMKVTFTSGSVGGAGGNPGSYPEPNGSALARPRQFTVRAYYAPWLHQGRARTARRSCLR